MMSDPVPVADKEDKFPEMCIRGISSPDLINNDGRPGVGLFQFQRGAHDIWLKESVNWEDDENVVDFTLAQRKPDGSIQFKGGIARIPREEIDHYKSLPAVSGCIDYERDPIIGGEEIRNNPYHGNILLRKDLDNATRKRIYAGLANLVSEVIIS